MKGKVYIEDHKKVLIERSGLVYQIEDSEGEKRALLISNNNIDITEVSIPDEISNDTGKYPVRGIGDRCFQACQKLERLVLPQTLKFIGENSFSCCFSLQEMHLPYNLEIIGRDCFKASGINEVDIPTSVRYVGYGAFSDCRSLSKVQVYGYSTIFVERCFADCINLYDISFAYEDVAICESCVIGCKSLNEQTRKHIKVRERGKMEAFYLRYENLVGKWSESTQFQRLKIFFETVLFSENFFSRLLLFIIILLLIVPFMVAALAYCLGILSMEFLESQYRFKHTNPFAFQLACVIIGSVAYIILLLIAVFINTCDFSVWSYFNIHP